MTIPTPVTPHLRSTKYQSVYPPAEDTFFLLDTLEQNHISADPQIVLEVGSGSGVVSTFVKTLYPLSCCFAVDISFIAAEASLETARTNEKVVEVLCSDLALGLEGLYGKVDLLIFNPPYVVTDSISKVKDSIKGAWAGGTNGREVIDTFLPRAYHFLSESGVFFLLGIKQNKPADICYLANSYGLEGSILAERKAGIEHLWIIKFTKNAKSTKATS